MTFGSKIDKIIEHPIFKVFCIIDTLIGVIAACFSEDNLMLRAISCIAIGLMLVIACVLIFRYKKFLDSEKRIDILEKHIHNGLKYTNNEVVVTLKKDEKKYHFEFIKEFEVISDNAPKWYSAQFYANKFLDDMNASKEYYEKNVVTWKSLNVRSTISYCHPNAEQFTAPQFLDISNISDKGNYIPFNIQYITYSRNRQMLDICTGTKVKLKYCYDVPIQIWGSYLNRSISYFSEPTKVNLKVAYDEELDIKVSLLSGSDGTPNQTSDYTISQDVENEYKVYEIILTPRSFAKYRIWWDSAKYFKDDITTMDSADKSQLTNS